MAIESPDTLGVAVPFNENLPYSGPPGSVSPGVSVLGHSSALATPISVPLTAPASIGSLKHEIFFVPGTPSPGTHAMPPFTGQPVHSGHLGLPPARHQPLSALETQHSLVSLSNLQEEPSLSDQPTPAPQETESPSTSGGATRKRPYVCSYDNCGKTYTKRSHLVCHERTHTGEKPYVCEWESCTWSFFRSDELKRHKLTHTRDRPHICRECGRRFMRADHLKQHDRTHRRLPKPQADIEPTNGFPVSGQEL
ncbi:Krueppel-like factor 17 [Acomys russatus]|uniref:Krueppel-like factor 17 n=1 Tax=Acomys russatus TaxID=60746 RepID=UPI0021E2699E|nr:Krueppel-like factor 17 [Acomys russatus]